MWLEEEIIAGVKGWLTEPYQETVGAVETHKTDDEVILKTFKTQLGRD